MAPNRLRARLPKRWRLRPLQQIARLSLPPATLEWRQRTCQHIGCIRCRRHSQGLYMPRRARPGANSVGPLEVVHVLRCAAFLVSLVGLALLACAGSLCGEALGPQSG